MRTMRFARTLVPVSVVGLVALVGLASALLSPSPVAALDEVTYQMSWIPTGSFAPLSAGIEKGYFRQVGINLNMTTGRG